jgi:hypothetical protein
VALSYIKPTNQTFSLSTKKKGDKLRRSNFQQRKRGSNWGRSIILIRLFNYKFLDNRQYKLKLHVHNVIKETNVSNIKEKKRRVFYKRRIITLLTFFSFIFFVFFLVSITVLYCLLKKMKNCWTICCFITLNQIKIL